MMPANTLILCNLLANRQRAARVAAHCQQLTQGRADVIWQFSEYHRHAILLARSAGEQGVRKVVAMGGDGTAHEVVNGLMQVPSERRPALGIIPVGSGNDFSRTLGIPADPVKALELALDGTLSPVDIARVQDQTGRSEYWTNTLGIGFDAVVNIRSRRIPWVRGFLIYFLSALQTILFNHTPMSIHARQDDQTWQQHLLMMVLCNGRREGGAFWVAPNANPRDGQLDFLGIQKISRLKMLYTIPFVMRGQQARLPYVCQGQFRRLELTSDQPLFIHTDGEVYAGLDSSLRHIQVEVVPSAIQVTVPPASL
jgi:YegS/Rv2252/BmrU family lipid kinase